MSERIAIVRNLTAKNGGSKIVDRVADKLRRGGQHVRIVETEYRGHATELASRIAATDEADVIVASGGDGTIREVAEGAYGHGVTLGIIPAGAANVLARELGYMVGGKRSARRVANAILSRDIVDLYPFEVEQKGRLQLGLCWLGAGFDAAILENVSPSLKAAIGRASFVPAIFKAMFTDGKLPPIPWQMTVEKTGETRWALVSNIQRYAGPFRLTSMTDYDQLGLVCLFSQGRGGWSRAIDQLSIAAMHHDVRTNSWAFDAGWLKLGGPDIPVQVDGDSLAAGAIAIRPAEQPLQFRAYLKKTAPA